MWTNLKKNNFLDVELSFSVIFGLFLTFVKIDLHTINKNIINIFYRLSWGFYNFISNYFIICNLIFASLLYLIVWYVTDSYELDFELEHSDSLHTLYLSRIDYNTIILLDYVKIIIRIIWIDHLYADPLCWTFFFAMQVICTRHRGVKAQMEPFLTITHH